MRRYHAGDYVRVDRTASHDMYRGCAITRMLSRPKAPQPIRLISQVFVGAAKRVGGDAESTVRIMDDSGQKSAKPQPNRSAKALEYKAKAAAGTRGRRLPGSS